MLTLTQALFDQIVAHSRADHPDEACGVVAGPGGRPPPPPGVPRGTPPPPPPRET
ncbi:Mov34/MPN/PAD-1 family protein, partial [Streptomyces sp. NPDC059744]|uniref:Mov34/MPN/PAD-1 family protein n=1 Tax=Streptomyces sp. NPDC059744 TaxID=3346929 RepID=UPI00365AE210